MGMTVEELRDLVKEQLNIENVWQDCSSMDDPMVNDFAFAATSIAKQMMETTKDAVFNAETVLNYGLPKNFFDLKDEEAKEMIKLGNFYPLASKLIQLAEADEFPMPDPAQPLSSFLDTKGKGIEEDSQSGGGAYDYTAAYKA